MAFIRSVLMTSNAKGADESVVEPALKFLHGFLVIIIRGKNTVNLAYSLSGVS